MQPNDGEPKRKYTRRVTSNGEDVYPTVCATQYKGVQQQMDKGGYYVLDYIKKSSSRSLDIKMRAQAQDL